MFERGRGIEPAETTASGCADGAELPARMPEAITPVDPQPLWGCGFARHGSRGPRVQGAAALTSTGGSRAC